MHYSKNSHGKRIDYRSFLRLCRDVEEDTDSIIRDLRVKVQSACVSGKSLAECFEFF